MHPESGPVEPRSDFRLVLPQWDLIKLVQPLLLRSIKIMLEPVDRLSTEGAGLGMGQIFLLRLRIAIIAANCKLTSADNKPAEVFDLSEEGLKQDLLYATHGSFITASVQLVAMPPH